jgi:putative ABC transport system permease protein
VKLRDLTELAARNLHEAMLRNSLTTLGIGVGVASLVAMLSLGVGLQQLASQRLSNPGLFNAVIVTPRNNIRGGFSRRVDGTNGTPPAPEMPLDDDARKKFAAMPNVEEVYPEIRFPTEIHYNRNPYPTVVAGVPQSAKVSGAYDDMQGQFFSGPDAQEAIVQIELARQLSAANPNAVIGQEITLNYAEREELAPAAGGAISGGFSVVPREDKLKIIGTTESEPVTGAGGFGQVRLMIPLEVAEKLQAAQVNDLRAVLGNNSGRNNYASLTVRVGSARQVQAVEDNIKAMGYGAFSLLDISRNLRLVFAVFDLLLGAFGSLALVVASLGIVNTLVMAILERRREIGILKALGASDADVKSLFFTEAGCMGVAGGILGVILGWGIGRAITFGANFYLHRQNLPSIELTSVPWWMALGAIAFSIGVSLAAGFYPASRAARLNPVEALRYE